MNIFKLIYRRITCKHKIKITLTNLHGDAINQFNGKRAVTQCVSCGKIIFTDALDPNCDTINFTMKKI